jgi:hypothetical protein
MPIDLSAELKHVEAKAADPERLRFAFGYACAERVRQMLEDAEVVRSLDVLAGYLSGHVGRDALSQAAAYAASLANRHQGSRSLDGVGHAAVSASYAVANALAGRASQAAEYAAYAAVYGGGGYGAVADPDSFVPEREWQSAKLKELAASLARAESAA